MKTQKLLIALFLNIGLFTSCDHDIIRASGEVTSLSYSVPEYSKIKVSNAFNTYVTFSDTEESIRIEANENVHDRVIVQRDGNSLVIRLKNITNVKGNATLNAYITTKHINEFDMNGASSLFLENQWNIENGSVELSGAADFIGEIVANQLELDLRGASAANIYGQIGSLHADLSGSSDIRDYDLSVDNLNLDMTGASEAYLSVNKTIDIEASGASELNFKGNATIARKKLSGASEIKNKN
ncbi:head GIN domain-containing protein [Aurantibacter sp.]|uniref:head GIN domain-containing protein n=1 Tax=Aurantibacter sp. TaxID=2807103 RepID=UPI003265FCB1